MFNLQLHVRPQTELRLRAILARAQDNAMCKKSRRRGGLSACRKENFFLQRAGAFSAVF